MLSSLFVICEHLKIGALDNSLNILKHTELIAKIVIFTGKKQRNNDYYIQKSEALKSNGRTNEYEHLHFRMLHFIYRTLLT